jgi:hypothetical protein
MDSIGVAWVKVDWWSLVIMLMKLLVTIKVEELFDQLSFSRSVAVFMELVVCCVTIPGSFFYLWPCCSLKVIILQLNAACSAVATLLEVFVQVLHFELSKDIGLES